jgi:GntR family transcriptional regulator/MocR family aminotransferase
VYQKKHAQLLSAIESNLGSDVKVIGQHSGLHIVLEVRGRGSEADLIRQAQEVGVKVYATSQYWISHGNQFVPPRLLLGFGGLSHHELEEGIRLLQEAWT